MKLLRSWPDVIPPGRGYVVDDIERLVIANHQYRALADVDDDVLLLEWDIAVGKEDLEAIARRAGQRPDRVLVAPYRIYVPHGIWAHRTWAGEGPGAHGAGPVAERAEFCNLFGLGLVYLPHDLIVGFIESGWARHFGDVQFSMWHYLHVAKEVPIDWAIRPVHLHHPGVDQDVLSGQ